MIKMKNKRKKEREDIISTLKWLVIFFSVPIIFSIFAVMQLPYFQNYSHLIRVNIPYPVAGQQINETLSCTAGDSIMYCIVQGHHNYYTCIMSNDNAITCLPYYHGVSFIGNVT